MTAQIGECMAAIVTLAAEVERQRDEIAGLREWIGRVAGNRAIPAGELAAADVYRRMDALEMAQLAVGDRVRAHVTLPARVRARQKEQRKTWWVVGREGLEMTAAFAGLGLFGVLLLLAAG